MKHLLQEIAADLDAKVDSLCNDSNVSDIEELQDLVREACLQAGEQNGNGETGSLIVDTLDALSERLQSASFEHAEVVHAADSCTAEIDRVRMCLTNLIGDEAVAGAFQEGAIVGDWYEFDHLIPDHSE